MFVCLGCQESEGKPSPCPGLQCSTGGCSGGCKPIKTCKILSKKIAKEEMSVTPNENRINKLSSIYCGNKDKKCKGCFKLPFIKSI